MLKCGYCPAIFDADQMDEFRDHRERVHPDRKGPATTATRGLPQ